MKKICSLAIVGLLASGPFDTGSLCSAGDADQINSADSRKPAALDFSRDVRPILANACYHCHGPDEKNRQADLRLDSAPAATADLGGYAAVVPGDIQHSELWTRISSSDADLVMPPPHSGKSLKPDDVAMLRSWIQQGAVYEDHWAFAPPQQTSPPEANASNWPRGEVDLFVLDRLNRADLSPADQANRETLIRRLSLDLVGLPPAPEEIDAFCNDTSPTAYENLVARLLDSVHYGERWGRVWLDAARYADSDGFEKDKPRFVHFYRDWVVNSLNRDLPYDQFVIKQIAGDMLPGATQDDQVATGFLRNSMINEEGGVDPEQFRMEAMYDRMDAIGKSVLGLTIQCAQCHSHKYDPLTHTDYYRMFAFLNNAHEANITVYTDEQQQQIAELGNRLAEVRQAMQRDNARWQTEFGDWLRANEAAVESAWTPLEIEFIAETQGGQKFLVQPDGSYLSQGYAPTKSTPTGDVQVGSLKKITAIRVDVMNDPNLPHGGPGRSVEGTWTLSEIELKVNQAGKWVSLPFRSAAATINLVQQPLGVQFADKSNKVREVGPVSLAIDGDLNTAWHGDIDPGRRNTPQTAMFVLAEPLIATDDEPLVFRIGLAQQHGGWNSDDNQTHNLGRFRVSATGADEPAIDLVPPTIREALRLSPLRRSDSQTASLLDHWIGQDANLSNYNDQLNDLWAAHPAGASQLVLAERQSRRPTHRLDRGSFLSPEELVQPGTPDFLLPITTTSAPTRLDFARWLVNRNHPTTARSLVNRVWQEYFGTGLSASSDDLGLQGEPPSHPELLDWMAVDLMDNGWSLKHLHRRIVTSATYQQSSAVSPLLWELDPANRLLARGPRFRVSAEVVRDIALAASGLINRRVGGPAVYPPAPEFLFEPPASYGPKSWAFDTDGDQYRRAVYTFRFRSVPYPALQAFDAPTGEVSCVRRSASNTPLQALTTLNEPLFLECAQKLAELSSSIAHTQDRIDFIFRRCVARRPTEAERKVLNDVLQQQRERLGNQPGDSPSQPNQWATLCRIVMNLDETITKE